MFKIMAIVCSLSLPIFTSLTRLAEVVEEGGRVSSLLLKFTTIGGLNNSSSCRQPCVSVPEIQLLRPTVIFGSSRFCSLR